MSHHRATKTLANKGNLSLWLINQKVVQAPILKTNKMIYYDGYFTGIYQVHTANRLQ
jgi:hypothetical protein